MTPQLDQSAPKETAVTAWVQTRVVLRIIVLLLAVAALLWIIYKLTTVLLLLVLSIFFAYLVAPLVDLVERPVRIGRRERKMPRGLAIGVVHLFWFTSIGAGIYFLMPQFAAQFPEFKQQATAYYKTITTTSDRINQYFMQHRMPEGVVKAVNNTVLGLIEKAADIATAAFERRIGMLIFLRCLARMPIVAFFSLQD